MKVKAVPIPTMERFMAWVDQEGPMWPEGGTRCWVWTGTLDKDGYGVWTGGLRKQAAYKWFWENETEGTSVRVRPPVRPGYELDHRCRNRACVRSSHLEEMTHKENTLRSEGVTAKNARKTHCDKGHELPEDRICRPCAAERVREHRKRKKAKA